ncbi:ADOP family duplicated permease [Gemmatimonadota bacterium DH-20]|uniref:ADOP family duplicated permease n=1 Tax=Gaopeijia maritima TaxID=3119007 RepID=A0ABU9E9G7_9BACT
MRPPALWTAVLRRVLPRRDREVLLDEFERLWWGKRAADGAAAARRWYRREALAFALRWPAEVVRRSTWKRGGEMLDIARQVRIAARSLGRSPGFTAVAVTTLAIGIGANAVIFGIVDRALLRPLPLPEPDRLVAVFDGWNTNVATLDLLEDRLTTVERIGGALDAQGRTYAPDGGATRRLTVASVTPGYLEALGVQPQLGRRFAADESTPGTTDVVLLGAGFWRESMGGDPEVLGRRLVLDGAAHTVVGVLPDGFDFPSARNDVWVPAEVDPADDGMYWGFGGYSSVARLRPGVAPLDLANDLRSHEEAVRLANTLWTPNEGVWDEVRITPLQEARAAWVRGPLTVLLAAVAVVLLVVCANVANLLLSRGLARRRDFAVRTALGAGRARLAADQLVESVLLAGIGTVVGLFLAAWGLAALRPHLPSALPGAGEVGLDLRVVGVTAGLAIFAALLAGALPALRSATQAPAARLRESGRGGGSTRSRRRLTRGLVAAQLAAAVVLVVSAGLLARSLFALGRVDPGFALDGRVTARLHLAPGLPGDSRSRALLFDEIEAGLAAAPELGGVALASTIPFGNEDEFIATFIPGVTDDPNALPVIRQHRVSAGYFEVAGIPVVRGRAFTAADRVGSPLVAIVDETFATTWFEGEDPIGRTVRYPWRGAPDMRIVGVVGATADGDLSTGASAAFWTPLAQMGMGAPDHVTVVATAGGTESAALGAIMRGVRELDERMAVSDLLPYEERLGASLAGTRLLALLLVLFAGTTLALGCVGVYGVAAFSVRERWREIGVRMAMGASADGIRRDVLREGLRLAVPGGLLGLLLALPATALLDGLLFGVGRFDWLTFTAVPLLLALAALSSVYLPARRATRVDPAVVLRGEG